MRLTTAIQKTATGIARRAIRRGPLHACRWVKQHVHERAEERRLGIETAEFGSWRDSVDHATCHAYEPLAYSCIEQAISQVFPDPAHEVFLDYGSGKGRAVVVAALRPFRRVLGVELVSELCDIARENVDRARNHLLCSNVEIECADAMQFRVPDDVTCIYLYNPFWDQVLAAVQERIQESLNRRPRRLRIAYLLNADQADAFAGCDWLQSTISRCELWERVHLAAYESTATGERTSEPRLAEVLPE
jgi:hypothetical protein